MVINLPYLRGAPMKYFAFILTFFCTCYSVNAQRIEQLTHNNTCDKWPTVYGDRIAWVGIDKSGGEEIFLLEGDSIRQITFTGERKFIPQLGPGYLVWMEEAPSPHKIKIMLYNGVNTREISRPNTLSYNLRSHGKIMTWNDIEMHYVYDGSRGVPLFNGWQSGKKSTIYGIGDSLIYYYVYDSLDRSLVSFNGSETKVIFEEKGGSDSSFSSDLLVGSKSIYYCVHDNATGFRDCYYYKDGITAKGPVWKGVFPYYNDSTLAWSEHDFINLGPLWLWDGKSTHKIAEYPYDQVIPGVLPNRPAVFGYYYVYENGNGRKGWREGLSFYDGENLLKLIPFGKALGGTWDQASNKVVWSTHDADDLEFSSSSEIFVMTMEHFTNPTNQSNSNLRVYYKPVSSQIHFEVLSPEIQQYNWAVFDILGRKVLEGDFNSNIGTKEVDAGPLTGKPGIYLVFTSSSDNEILSTTKIFVDH
jgi:hypothetical protein